MMTTTPATQAILPVTPEGPFHVSRSSDGTKKWFSARDPASGVTIPAKDRDDAYALVSSLNRACSTYAASQAHPLPGDAQESLNYWNEVANRLGHESVCEALEKLDELQSTAALT